MVYKCRVVITSGLFVYPEEFLLNDLTANPTEGSARIKLRASSFEREKSLYSLTKS